jgi:hypothetical protein
MIQLGRAAAGISTVVVAMPCFSRPQLPRTSSSECVDSDV